MGLISVSVGRWPAPIRERERTSLRWQLQEMRREYVEEIVCWKSELEH